ncbi:MAG: leucine-rich repeat protein [Bacteroidales bacterium]|nr:leucine-rich repeat protein [Bacteroidales bacterium]
MIETEAFANCTSLTLITIPDSVTEIGEDAFSNCASLTSVVIPSRVSRMGI